MADTILVTGGAGYIGSHTVLALLQQGWQVVVLDNFVNSTAKPLQQVEKITGCKVTLIQGDVRDQALLTTLFSQHKIAAVLHFAGLKSVGESTRVPLEYYFNNVVGTLELCRAMAAAGVFRLVFSSSATVYGDPHSNPISEGFPVGEVVNPYGRSKFMVEGMLQDLAASDERWQIALLRYFNPVGAHESGLIGEDPNGVPNNLMPYVADVAAGRLPELAVFGDDYPTSDGTGVRDYIHVVDLAEGHLKALDYIGQHGGLGIWNLGTGQGYSVLEMVKAFEQASGKAVPYRIAPRRLGDVAMCWADSSKAEKELGWKAKYDLERMVVDTWRWQLNR